MKLIAKGNTAEIYEYENNLICKLFYPDYPTDYIKHEFYNATLVEKLGISTPRVHKFIVEGGREGIIYDKITGEGLSRKLGETQEASFDIWMNKFVDFHKEIMKHSADDAIDYKDFLKMFATDEETIAKINALDDGNYLMHGDFHLENVMVDGDNNLVLIDMMNICKGPVLYDVARTYFLLRYDNIIQEKYLDKIGYSLEDIMPYLDVILAVREKEIET